MKQYKKMFCLLLGGLLLSNAMMSFAMSAPETVSVDAQTVMVAAEAAPAEIYD